MTINSPRPMIPLTPAQEQRFWARVEKTQSCWLWIGDLHPEGYGAVALGSKGYLAHRVSYWLARGEIPAGHVLDHICRVRNCVNPEHLRPVTNVDNILAGVSPPAINARKTHCKWGHEFTPENTIVRPDGQRNCRTCFNAPWVCPYCGINELRRYRRRHTNRWHPEHAVPIIPRLPRTKEVPQ